MHPRMLTPFSDDVAKLVAEFDVAGNVPPAVDQPRMHPRMLTTFSDDVAKLVAEFDIA